MENSGRVLVVDDQPLNVKLLAAQLQAAGYEVFKAYSGEEALAIVQESPPDIVLLDIMMPGLDGYAVTARLKKDPSTTIIPIVLLTALEGTDDKVQGLDAGADDFLTKPVNRSELLARMRSLIKLKRLQEELKKRTEPVPIRRVALNEPARRKVILLIEDDDKILKHSRLILEKAGYETVIAKDGHEAEAVLGVTVPDLIVLDIMLPDMNGLELLKRIRENALLADTPVVITSALADLETKVRGIDTGADDYLVKPVNSLEMLARVKSNLRKQEASHKLRLDLDVAFAQSITDPLTGLYNRQHLSSILEREMAASRRYNRKSSLFMLDIDHFKTVNDTHGHLAGDSVLQELALLLKAGLRASDIATRYGGEEFVVVLPDTDLPGAMILAERFRNAVEDHPFSKVADRRITVSIGVTQCRPDDGTVDSSIKRADEALYRAKDEGRNMVRGAA